jgi:oligosaccharide repeat unit polymerase
VIYIPFIYFLVLLVVNVIRTKSFNLGSFLLSLYAFSALLSIFLYSVEFLHYKDTDIALSSCIFYCVVLTIFFYPFLSKSRSKEHRIVLPDDRAFMYISFFLIAINIAGILLLLKIIVFVLGYDPKSLRDAGLKSIYSIGTIESAGLWLLGHFSDFYLVLLIFFFYSVTYLKKGAAFNSLLFIASLSTIVNGLTSGGRTQIIYWLLVFISCFLYFRKDMATKLRKRLVFFGMIILSVIVIYIAAVTASRFENAFSGETDYEEAFSILDYSGQIFLNFNNFFTNFEHKGYTFARIFPFIYDWTHPVNFDLSVYKRSIAMDIGVFSTFLGDWYIDMGITGIVLYTFFYSIAGFFIKKDYIPGTRKIQQLLLYFLIFQVPLNGLFYYSLYNKTAMISVIGTVIICCIFRFAEGERMELANKSIAV